MGATRKVEFPSDVRRITTWIFIGWSMWDDRDETRTFGKVAFKFRDTPVGRCLRDMRDAPRWMRISMQAQITAFVSRQCSV